MQYVMEHYAGETAPCPSLMRSDGVCIIALRAQQLQMQGLILLLALRSIAWMAGCTTNSGIYPLTALFLFLGMFRSRA